jgi:hypothetical protein
VTIRELNSWNTNISVQVVEIKIFIYKHKNSVIKRYDYFSKKNENYNKTKLGAKPIACFTLIRHGLHRKLKHRAYTELYDFISLLTKIRK